MTDFQCPSCDATIRFDPVHAGRSTWCRACCRMIVFPSPRLPNGILDLSASDRFRRLDRLFTLTARQYQELEAQVAQAPNIEHEQAQNTKIEELESQLSEALTENEKVRAELLAAWQKCEDTRAELLAPVLDSLQELAGQTATDHSDEELTRLIDLVGSTLGALRTDVRRLKHELDAKHHPVATISGAGLLAEFGDKPLVRAIACKDEQTREQPTRASDDSPHALRSAGNPVADAFVKFLESFDRTYRPMDKGGM